MFLAFLQTPWLSKSKTPASENSCAGVSSYPRKARINLLIPIDQDGLFTAFI